MESLPEGKSVYTVFSFVFVSLLVNISSDI